MSGTDYHAFLAAKAVAAPRLGFDVRPDEVHPALKPHQRDIVCWKIAGGRRACFAAFGMGKSVIQLEAVRLTRERAGGLGMIVCPLGVRAEFRRDATEILGIETRFIRSIEEVDDERVIYLTNYETVRDGRLDPRAFTVVSLDEAAVLRGFGGSKTFRQFMRLFAGDDRSGVRTEGVPYRYVATATPSPNEFIELLAYAAYLDVMDVGQAKTRFFRRNSEKADALTLHPHKEAEFWAWVGTWATFVQRPSDLGHSDEGYELPDLDVRWHEIPSDYSAAGEERDGQVRLVPNAALGVQDAAREKRLSLEARTAKVLELRAEDPEAHRVLWHDLEAERRALEEAIPGLVTVYGSQDLEEREDAVAAFAAGQTPEIGAKPVMLGSGCNLQRHCAWAIYTGIGFKFKDFIQSLHRLHRFLQTRRVRVDLIYTEAEREIRAALERRWRQHEEMVERMAGLIRQHGLAHAPAAEVGRTMDVERQVVEGPGYRLVCGDAAEELRSIESDSIDLIVTSPPFSTQYEYSPSYRDLGHTDDDRHFFEHLAYITAELFRVLKPGRIAAVHCKDRVVPGGLRGWGFQTVSRFSDALAAHLEAHGFAFLARRTIVTDVVRENNQTYRLGYSEQCKDGSRMGAGMPEYVLLVRKPPTDRTDGYADEPVVKSKAEYSLARWQLDAHGFWRSSGQRFLLPEELADLPHNQVYRLFKRHGLAHVYDYEHHVALGEAMAEQGRLPVTFMLLPPHSWHPDVLSDVARMRTLNAAQASKGREMHLCPLQFDIVDRLITQHSQAGETVLDPFGGLMTVPYRALKLGRKGLATELSPGYFADGVAYVEAAAREAAMPTLFDLLEDAAA